MQLPQNIESRMNTRLDDGIGTKNTQLLWIHWSNHVISFHEEAGYERLEFPTYEKKMEYVFGKTSNGFRIQ